MTPTHFTGAQKDLLCVAGHQQRWFNNSLQQTSCGLHSYTVIGMEIPLGSCSVLHFQPQGSILSSNLPLPAFLCSMKPAVQTRRALVTAG